MPKADSLSVPPTNVEYSRTGSMIVFRQRIGEYECHHFPRSGAPSISGRSPLIGHYGTVRRPPETVQSPRSSHIAPDELRLIVCSFIAVSRSCLLQIFSSVNLVSSAYNLKKYRCSRSDGHG